MINDKREVLITTFSARRRVFAKDYGVVPSTVTGSGTTRYRFTWTPYRSQAKRFSPALASFLRQQINHHARLVPVAERQPS